MKKTEIIQQCCQMAMEHSLPGKQEIMVFLLKVGADQTSCKEILKFRQVHIFNMQISMGMEKQTYFVMIQEEITGPKSQQIVLELSQTSVNTRLIGAHMLDQGHNGLI